MSICQAGPAGDGCRSLHEPGTKLVHIFEAWSELDHGQKYYDYMDFGTYYSLWPELAIRPFRFVDGLENLGKLKKPLKPLMEISVMADGSTKPVIPDPMPRIMVQHQAVCAVDVWINGESEGYAESPVNEADLIGLADHMLREKAPG